MISPETPTQHQHHKTLHSQLTFGGVVKLAVGTIVGMVTFAILMLIAFVHWSVR